ncbi:snoaL-like domain protein [Mycobacterium kansasii 732]|uniref:Bile acid 7-alpha dehydratase n=1 Tax=Mycobacterium pseudokansasii TaxID=2341080 RepID=A0A498QL41_9MYCO|nr:nuclear transport factor 2 family protein [Mycobacterium pseudokansasii]EUA14448.1 snoaL-like domain protein [Mycobacterium kansasii 732]MBY0388973.1 nuclear transport factor 2 family protein [Mycobacterium pseudokansasii]VBA46667.1 Bile acid 7-alpha dehydratase [Mycobacterium pseudokansasii]
MNPADLAALAADVAHFADVKDVEAIKQLKYRYLRALDTKHWDDFADTLTEDVRGDYGSSLGKELHFTNRDDVVEYLRSALGPDIITEHRVTHPEIAVTGDTATGSWYLQDRVIVAEANFMLIGAAFYRDEYRRTPDGWRISATGYDRTYEATMSVANLGFTVRPGRALAD